MKTKSGFSVAEALVALAVLGLGAAAVSSVIVQNRREAVKGEVASVFDASLSTGLDRAMAVVSQVGEGRNEGLCRLLDTGAVSGGLGYIFAHLPAQDPFTAEWAREFPSGAFTDCTSSLETGTSAKYWQKCFSPKAGSLGITDDLLRRSPQFRILINPVKVRNDKGAAAGYTPIALGGKSDARDTAFLVTARVLYDNEVGGGRVSRERYSLVWAGEVTCNKPVGGKTLQLSASGIGSGSSTDAQLFSASQKSSDLILKGENRITVYTEGRVDARDNRARTLVEPEADATGRSKNFISKAGCVESTYRCRKPNVQRRWGDFIESKLAVRYSRNNPYTKGDDLSVRARVALALNGKLDGSRKAPIPLNSTVFYLDGADAPLGFADANAKDFSVTTTFTQNNLTGRSPAGPACSQVCTDGQSYNDERVVTDPYVLGYKFRLAEFKDENGGNIDVSVKDLSASLSCVCCYGKQCAAIGTRTKGLCMDQPPEPLDSRLPECAADLSTGSAGLADRLPIVNPPQGSTTQLVRYQNLGVNKCLAVRSELVSGTRQLVVESKPCDTSLPPVCYSQGTFMLSPTRGSFGASAQACYGLGRESVGKAELDQMLLGQFGADWMTFVRTMMPPAEGDKYDFVNAALAGIFLAPQDDQQLAALAANAGIADNQWHWIALTTDKDSRIVGAAPPAAPNPSEYVSFFDFEGDLHFVRDQSALPFKVAPASEHGHLILHHSRKVLGVVPVQGLQAPTSVAALCWNPSDGKFSRSSGVASDSSKVAKLCHDEGKVFYPPTRPLQWAAALLLAKPNDELLPFPRFRSTDTLAGASLWVALVRPPNGDAASWVPAYRMPSFHEDPATGVKFANHLMNPWGEPVASATRVDYALCRSTGGALELVSGDSCRSGQSWGEPRDDYEEAALYERLDREGNLKYGVVIQIRDTPPPPPAPEPTASPSVSP